MADMVPVTREQLAVALCAMAVAVRPESEAARHGELVVGTLAYPDEIATALLDDAEQQFRKLIRQPPVLLPAAGQSDPEAVFLTDATDALNRMDDEARGRVLRYLADRYGVACGSCAAVSR